MIVDMTLGGRVGRESHAPGSIGERFESRPNALNFLRLCLALEVVLWHAYALRGDSWLSPRAEHVLADIAVDAFFAISGFLVCRSWQRSSSPGSYLAARARRILPGLWACLIVTAFVIAPAAALVSGSTVPTLRAQAQYVFANAGVWVTQYDIAGGPTGVAHSALWNGSLWSLGFEAACYVGLALLAMCRLLRPGVIWLLVLTMWLVAATATLVGVPLVGTSGLVVLILRTVLMFGLGVLLFLHRERVPASPRLLMAMLGLLMVGALLAPDYRVVAAPAVAYLAIYGGLWLGRFPRLRLRSDLSYGTYVYGFPIQQALLVSGVALGWFGFALLSIAVTVPVAFLSWHLVERRALRRTAAASPLHADISVPAVGFREPQLGGAPS